MWEIVYYKTASGRVPVKDYIANLDKRESGKVIKAITTLNVLGVNLKAPHTKNISGKLWELRIKTGKIHRIFYMISSGRKIILLHAFTKKTRKTPASELNIAKRRMNLVDWSK